MRRDSLAGRLARMVGVTALAGGLLLVLSASAGVPAPGGRGGYGVGREARRGAMPALLQGPEGKQLFAKHCVSCHGSEGRGDGTAGRGMKPPPPDIASADFLTTITDDSIATVIRNGRGGMKPLGKVLTRPQIRLVIAYLRELGQQRGK